MGVKRKRKGQNFAKNDASPCGGESLIRERSAFSTQKGKKNSEIVSPSVAGTVRHSVPPFFACERIKEEKRIL